MWRQIRRQLLYFNIWPFRVGHKFDLKALAVFNLESVSHQTVHLVYVEIGSNAWSFIEGSLAFWRSRYPCMLSKPVSAVGTFFFYCQAIKICIGAERPSATKPRQQRISAAEGEKWCLRHNRRGAWLICGTRSCLWWEDFWDVPASSLEEAYGTL